MKKNLSICADTLFCHFVRVLTKILYGRFHQRQNGWRGDYAKYMAEVAGTVCRDKNKIKDGFVVKLQHDRPELCRSKMLLHLHVYDFLLAQALVGAKLDDWFDFRFFKHGWIYRWKCNTSYRNRFFNDLINRRAEGLTRYLDNKGIFASHWKDFFNREWMIVKSGETIDKDSFFNKFGSRKIVVKPLKGWGGNHFYIFEADETEKAFDYVKLINKDVIIEEFLFQTGILHELNESSLNTVRIVTLMMEDKPMVYFAYLRVGKEGAIVDNLCAGGDEFSVDVDTGLVMGGTNHTGEEVKKFHNGQSIQGFTIPRWDDAKEFCICAHSHAPKGLNLIGWDVCISDDYLCMIEGNANPVPTVYFGNNKNQWGFMQNYLDKHTKKMESN